MRGFSALVTPRGDAGAAAVVPPPAVRPAADRSLTGWRRTLVRTCTIVGIGAAAWCATSLGSTAYADGIGSLVGDVTGTVEVVAAPAVSVVQQVAAPVVQVAAPVVAQVAAPVAPLVAPVAQVVAPVAQVAAPVVAPIAQAVAPVVAPVAQVTAPVAAVVAPVVAPVAQVVAPVAQVITPVVVAVEPVVAPVTAAVEPIVAPVVTAVEPVTAPVVDALAPLTPVDVDLFSPVAAVGTPAAAPSADAVGPVLADLGSAVAGGVFDTHATPTSTTASESGSAGTAPWFFVGRAQGADAPLVVGPGVVSAVDVAAPTGPAVAEAALPVSSPSHQDRPVVPVPVPAVPVPAPPAPGSSGAGSVDPGQQLVASLDDSRWRQDLALHAASALSDHAALSAPADEPGNSPD